MGLYASSLNISTVRRMTGWVLNISMYFDIQCNALFDDLVSFIRHKVCIYDSIFKLLNLEYRAEIEYKLEHKQSKFVLYVLYVRVCFPTRIYNALYFRQWFPRQIDQIHVAYVLSNVSLIIFHFIVLIINNIFFFYEKPSRRSLRIIKGYIYCE